MKTTLLLIIALATFSLQSCAFSPENSPFRRENWETWEEGKARLAKENQYRPTGWPGGGVWW